MIIRKPIQKDIPSIEKILNQWTQSNDVSKNIDFIKQEIVGNIIDGMRFWVLEDEKDVKGICGIGDPLRKLLPFAKTDSPTELKLLFVDENARGKGYGNMMFSKMSELAKKEGATELFAKSAAKDRCSAYDFYGKKGFERIHRFEERKLPLEIFRKAL